MDLKTKLQEAGLRVLEAGAGFFRLHEDSTEAERLLAVSILEGREPELLDAVDKASEAAATEDADKALAGLTHDQLVALADRALALADKAKKS